MPGDGPKGVIRPEGEQQPSLIEVRRRPDARAAVVFVHGFSGSARDTWGDFPKFLAAEPGLSTWDVYSLGYPTSLRIDVPSVWAADPPLARLSLSLQTALSVPPLADYQAIALIGHSMGGLVIQDALLNRKNTKRVGIVALFGTPSGGLYKALIGAPLKRQVRDMFPWSPFMLSLRFRWWARFGRRCPFDLCIVAGERDEFVPPWSSLDPFPRDIQRVVPGNHLGIVKPSSREDRSVQLVLEMLSGAHSKPTRVDSALLAVERREFHQVVEDLLPFATKLDDVGLVALALALDGIGREREALDVLEAHYSRGAASTDALGVLAGRMKRRWLAGQRQGDWTRSRALYAKALVAADPAGDMGTADCEQAMYHSINIAFLDLMASPPSSAVPRVVRDMLVRSKSYADKSLESHWRHAVLGDVNCMEGDLTVACESYTLARKSATGPREIDSMYSQAVRIATRLYGVDGARRVEACFCLLPPENQVQAGKSK